MHIVVNPPMAMFAKGRPILEILPLQDPLRCLKAIAGRDTLNIMDIATNSVILAATLLHIEIGLKQGVNASKHLIFIQ